MKLGALVTNSLPRGPATTVGVAHDGSSARAVFHRLHPVFRSKACTNEPPCTSHCTITRPSSMIGELALPHSYSGKSYAPALRTPTSCFHRSAPFMSYAYRPCEPKKATTVSPSVAGVWLA